MTSTFVARVSRKGQKVSYFFKIKVLLQVKAGSNLELFSFQTGEATETGEAYPVLRAPIYTAAKKPSQKYISIQKLTYDLLVGDPTTRCHYQGPCTPLPLQQLVVRADCRRCSRDQHRHWPGRKVGRNDSLAAVVAKV